MNPYLEQYCNKNKPPINSMETRSTLRTYDISDPQSFVCLKVLSTKN